MSLRKCALFGLLAFLFGVLYAEARSSGFFEETRSGTAPTAVAARRKAMASTQAALATRVNGKLESVARSYVDHNSGTSVSLDEFMSTSRLAAKAVLRDVEVVDESVVKEKDGRYTAYITLRVAKEAVLAQLLQELGDDATPASRENLTRCWEEDKH